MARLAYNIWADRKRLTCQDLVDQGCHSLNVLDEFLKERGIALPKDMSGFQEIWDSINAAAEDKQKSEKAPSKASVPRTRTTKTTKKPAKRTTKRSIPNIKESKK